MVAGRLISSRAAGGGAGIVFQCGPNGDRLTVGCFSLAHAGGSHDLETMATRFSSPEIFSLPPPRSLPFCSLSSSSKHAYGPAPWQVDEANDSLNYIQIPPSSSLTSCSSWFQLISFFFLPPIQGRQLERKDSIAATFSFCHHIHPNFLFHGTDHASSSAFFFILIHCPQRASLGVQVIRIIVSQSNCLIDHETIVYTG